MSKRGWSKVRLFSEPQRKRRKLPKTLLELHAHQLKLAKHNCYTRIRKGKDGCYFLEPTGTPTKRVATFRPFGTGHIKTQTLVLNPYEIPNHNRGTCCCCSFCPRLTTSCSRPHHLLPSDRRKLRTHFQYWYRCGSCCCNRKSPAKASHDKASSPFCHNT